MNRSYVDPRIALEAWEWMSGTHAMIKNGGTYSALERLRKAETCLSTAVEWEGKHPTGAKRFISEELDPRHEL